METTVLAAKTQLSKLLRLAEEGEEVLIRRGTNGPLFRVVPVREEPVRSLTPDPRWKDCIRYADEAIWESEWSDSE